MAFNIDAIEIVWTIISTSSIRSNSYDGTTVIQAVFSHAAVLIFNTTANLELVEIISACAANSMTIEILDISTITVPAGTSSILRRAKVRKISEAGERGGATVRVN
jgi:hypothetical protein